MPGESQRSVSLRRVSAGQFVAANTRGSELTFGTGDGDFTPIEMLLAAIAGCTALDVDSLTRRRAEPDPFEVHATADKVRDDSGNHLENIEIVFRVAFPVGESGDAARAVLPDAIAKSHDRLCTVTRTVELGTPVSTRTNN